MQQLFKKGNPNQPADHRGLLVQNHLGKVHGQLLRQAVSPHAPSLLSDQQNGGIPGRGTVCPALTVEAFISAAVVAGLSWSIIFVDVMKAFDTVVRQLAMGAD